MGESIYDTGADAEAGEGTRTGHKSDFGNVSPRFVVFF